MAIGNPSQPFTGTVQSSDPEKRHVGTEPNKWWPSIVNDITKTSVHPGHIFLITSLPLCYRAHRDYAKTLSSLDQIVNKTYQSFNQNHMTNIDADAAEIKIRRAIGFSVAGQALRVATYASVGGFCFGLSILFYSQNWRTFHQATHETKVWATNQRKRLDHLLGIQRIDEDHPEYKMMKSMTEEEEYNHISDIFLSASELDDKKKNDS